MRIEHNQFPNCDSHVVPIRRCLRKHCSPNAGLQSPSPAYTQHSTPNHFSRLMVDLHALNNQSKEEARSGWVASRDNYLRSGLIRQRHKRTRTIGTVECQPVKHTNGCRGDREGVGTSSGRG